MRPNALEEERETAVDWIMGKDIRPAALKMVAVAIAWLCDDKTGSTDAGQEEIAAVASMQVRQLRDHLARLEELDIIDRKRRQRDTSRVTLRYFVERRADLERRLAAGQQRDLDRRETAGRPDAPTR